MPYQFAIEREEKRMGANLSKRTKGY